MDVAAHTRRRRGLGVTFLAACAVLLPLLCPASGTHPPAEVLPACATVAACVGLVGSTRRQLSPGQALAALAASQAAFHAAYVVPGVCAARWHTSVSWCWDSTGGHAPWELATGHAVAVIVALRVLGATQALSQPLRLLAHTAGQQLVPLVARLPVPLPELLLVRVRRDSWAPARLQPPLCQPGRAPPHPRLPAHRQLRLVSHGCLCPARRKGGARRRMPGRPRTSGHTAGRDRGIPCIFPFPPTGRRPPPAG